MSPPGTGTTENVRAVQDFPTVYALTELTPASLVTGRDSDDGVDHSLLPKLNGKTLAIKDLTPAIDLPQDQRNRLFEMLRDAFDGSMARHTTMVGTSRYEATFNCITGVTNAIEKMWRQTLPEEIQQTIESWEIDRDYSGDGSMKREKIRVRLASKAAALELAMKYLKLITENTNIAVNAFDWDQFYGSTQDASVEEAVSLEVTQFESNSGRPDGR